MRKKEWVARLASSASLFALTRTLLPGARHRLLILAYHRVLPTALVSSDSPFDVELVSATAEDFAWQVKFLRDRFRPVTIAQIVESARGGRRLPPRAVLITFDDGYADNYDFAFPILQEAGVPACFFVSTDIVGTDTTFWFDYVAQILMRVRVGAVALPGGAQSLPTGSDLESRRHGITNLLSYLKEIPDADRREFIARLRRDHGNVVDDGAPHLSRPLNWEQVRQMARAGFEFGSHGATHAVLTRVPPQQLEQEVAGSRVRLMTEIGSAVEAIAYPVGGPRAVSSDVVKAVQACGYRLGFTYIDGANPLADFDPYMLLRQKIECANTRAYFEAQVSWPRYW